MTNEEKLREALMRVMDLIDMANQPISRRVYENVTAVLKETEPPKPEHPAIKAFYDWYVGDGEDEEPEKLTGIDKVLLERRRETFLAGYKAGMLKAADMTFYSHTAGDITKYAEGVPTV